MVEELDRGVRIARFFLPMKLMSRRLAHMRGGMQEQVPALRCKQKLPSRVMMRQTALPFEGCLVIV